ncbi:MAG: GYD domain-containing protein [Gammaproteobacteria bacterium]|nr:GYD domain-containing protein [Gammaproteobacteria bacterium]
MATFLMLGNYSAKAMEGISATRADKAEDIIKKQKGKILSLHALLG